MISVYTFTLGRPLYLHKVLKAVIGAAAEYEGSIEHHICFQAVEPDASTVELIEQARGGRLGFRIHSWSENIGISAGMNRIVPQLRGNLIIKMDDDCLIRSDDFFSHVAAIAELKPRAVFSPFPVGLVQDPGGPPAVDRHVVHSRRTDTYYTFRRVDHVGGLCRIAPSEIVRSWVMEPNVSIGGSDDNQHSALCLAHGVDMFYLENALVVEHLESSLGQRARYGEYLTTKERSRHDYRSRSLFQRGVTRVERGVYKITTRLRRLSQ